MTELLPSRAQTPAQQPDGTRAPRELLRLATAGSVDDGKSTLIGRLLYDTDSLPLDHLESVRDDDGVPDLAALSDGLRAEREQGITIDVAYRFFSTPRRNFVLADTPGHERYTRNMFTGASNAHVAVLLVDARAGVLRQTRRHARIATLLGVPHLVAAVNKMDLVGWDRTRFEEVAAQLHDVAERLGGVELLVVPIAAKHGDNVVTRSAHSPWYEGPTLLEHLETVEATPPDYGVGGLRLPVQWVSRPEAGSRRRYTGRMASGSLSVGDEIVVLPAGSRSRVTAIDTLDEERTTAVPPLSVAVELADDIDVGRGDLLVAPGDQPPLARELLTSVCWMSGSPLRVGDRVALKHTTRTVRAVVQQIHDRLDPETLDTHADPAELALNDIGTLTLRTSAVVLADPYVRNRETGAFILIDEHSNDTVGAGTVLEARDAAHVAAAATDAVWHPSAVGREQRAAATGQRGGTLWLTGLDRDRSAAVEVALERALLAQGRMAYVVDGAAVQHGLCHDLTDAPGDRIERARRIAHLARVVADSGVVAIAAAGAPATAHALHAAAGLPCAVVQLGDHPEVGAGAAPEQVAVDVRVHAAPGSAEEVAQQVLAALAGHPLLERPPLSPAAGVHPHP